MGELRVLYLEDEALLGRIVKESLETRDCRLDWFQSVADYEARTPDEEAYDIAVLDVQLPGPVDGFQFGKSLRRRRPGLPIVT